MDNKNYDIIGDIHGHSFELENLLIKLGYQQYNGTYTHPDRIAIFIGDYIDRGNNNLKVAQIVKSMVKSGSAKAIMGNHEYNAIGFHTVNKNSAGETYFLREQNAKNINQHKEFLKEQGKNPTEASRVIEWFKTLPLFIEEPGIRLVHAAWNQDIIDLIKPQLNDDNSLPIDFLIRSFEEDTIEYNAIETLLKGPEEQLSTGEYIIDNDGNTRKNKRIKWWEDFKFQSHNPVIFFGHYWCSGKPVRLNEKCCCVDFSIAKGGTLACYRWSGETEINNENFVTYP